MADELVQATQPFNATVKGVPVAVQEGDLFRSSDPLVKTHKGLFREPKVRDSQLVRRPLAGRGAPSPETASAAPGERRTRGRPAAADPPPTPPAADKPPVGVTASEV